MITIIILIIVTTTIIILPSSVVLIMVGILIALIWLINNEYKYRNRNKNENRIKQRLSSDSSQINQIEIKQKPRGWLDWEKSPHMRYIKRIARMTKCLESSEMHFSKKNH